MRLPLWTRVLLVCWCFCGLAKAQQFAFGASISGTGTFGSGLFNTGLPGTFNFDARVEWLDGIADGFGVRSNFGTSGLEVGIIWRLDLSQSVNATVQVGFALLNWETTGLVGRFGLEYRFSSFAVALEYGWRSPFVGTPNLRSNLQLSFLWLVAVN